MSTELSPIALARQFIFGRSAIAPVKIAYSLEETAAAWGVEPNRVSHAIHQSVMPARHNGRRYLVAGGTIRDILGDTEPAIEINDHRLHLQADIGYTYNQVATMFGWSAQSIRRLNYAGRLVPDVTNATVPLISGKALLDYLNGSDGAMTGQASA